MDEHAKRANLTFISYRREDSAGVTGRIYDRLVQKFGREAIFKDVDSIPLGVNFRQYIDSVVGQCSIVLVVIGDRWMGVTSEAGKCRLDEPRDFVRIEIESALQRNIPVIPLLVQNASMPQEERLPPTLAELAYRNGMTIGHDPHFHGDIDRLIKHLEKFFADLSNAEDQTSRQNAARGLYVGILHSTEEDAQVRVQESDSHKNDQMPTGPIEPKLPPPLLRSQVLGRLGLIISGSTVVLIAILVLALSLRDWRQDTAVNNSFGTNSTVTPTATSNAVKVEKGTALRVLNDYKFGIYFPSMSPDLSKAANDMRDKLIQYGFKKERIQLYSRGNSFFEAVVPPQGYEIRYEPGYEDDAVNILENILREIYPSKSFRKQIVEAGRTAGRTENFISLFLGSESQN